MLQEDFIISFHLFPLFHSRDRKFPPIVGKPTLFLRMMYVLAGAIRSGEAVPFRRAVFTSHTPCLRRQAAPTFILAGGGFLSFDCPKERSMYQG